jgi:hypothetical protein
MTFLLSGFAVLQVDGVAAVRVAHAQSRAILNGSNYAALRNDAFFKSRLETTRLADLYQSHILADPSAQARLLAGQPPVPGDAAAEFFAAPVSFTTSPQDGLLGLSPLPAPPAVVSETLQNLNALTLSSQGRVLWLQTLRNPLPDDPSTPLNESQAWSPWVYRLRVRAAEESRFSQGATASLAGVRDYEMLFRPVVAVASVVPPPPVEPLCSDFGPCAPPPPPSVAPPAPPALPTYVRTLEAR